MAERRRRTENARDKAAESADDRDRESRAMDRFKSLARRLVKVPWEELAAEQRRHTKTKARQRHRGG
jgi:hypothetical protein